MNYKMIVRLLAGTLLLLGLFMLPAVLVALIHTEKNCAMAFGITAGCLIAVCLPIWLRKTIKTTLRARESYALVAIAWVAVSMIGAIPMWACGSIPHYLDALFEAVSGITTTGSSILTDVEAQPQAVLYWRAFLNWFGGMGVLVFLLAIVPMAVGSGESMNIMKAESPGPQVNKLVPKTKKSAMLLYEIYIGMTVLELVLLLLGNMPFFDALTASMANAGTGGFGIKGDSMTSYSAYIQWVITIFMFLFGVNFGIYYLIIQRDYKKIWKNEELRVYFLMVLAAIAFLVIQRSIHQKTPFGENLLTASFTVTSVMSSTGFANADFDLWPQTCRMTLVLLMVIGACAGSTGGGAKVSRFIILFRSIRQNIKQILHPSAYNTVKMDGEPVGKGTVQYVSVFIGSIFLLGMASMFLVSLDGFTPEETASAVISCLNNIGPGLGRVGPAGNFASFSYRSKIILSLDMLLGRLELFPILVLLFPSTWQRAKR